MTPEQLRERIRATEEALEEIDNTRGHLRRQLERLKAQAEDEG